MLLRNWVLLALLISHAGTLFSTEFNAATAWAAVPVRKSPAQAYRVKPPARPVAHKVAPRPVGPSIQQAAQGNQSIALLKNGLAFGERDQYPEAMAALTQSIKLATPLLGVYPELKGNVGQAWAMLGYCHNEQGQTDKAVNAMQKALAYLPANKVRANISGQLGSIYMLRNQLDKARPLLTEAIALGDSNSENWQNYLSQMGTSATPIANGDNYVANLKAPYPLWDNTHRQLNIHIQPGQAVFGQEVKNAFIHWQQKLGGLFTFVFVDDPNAADCHIVWTPVPDPAMAHGEDHYASGYNFKESTEHNVYRNDIYLSLTTLKREVPTAQDMFNTTVHEIGHMLGISGHSPSPGDVMVASSPESHVRRQITSRDAATILALYNPAITGQRLFTPANVPLAVFTQYQKKLFEGAELVKQKKLFEARQLMEEALQLYNGHPIGAVMLGDVYIRLDQYAKAKSLLAPWANGNHSMRSQVQANFLIAQINETYTLANKGHWDLAKPRAQNALQNLRVVIAQPDLRKDLRDYLFNTQTTLLQMAQYKPHGTVTLASSYANVEPADDNNTEGAKKKRHWWQGSNYSNQAPVYIPMPSRW